MARADYAISAPQRIDARAALTILDGTGISLEEAARRAVQGRRALRRIDFATAADEFLRSRLSLRARTVEWYDQRLRFIVGRFGASKFDEITRAEFVAWVRDSPHTESMRASLVRACRALWRWGIAQEPQLVAIDITVGLKSAVRTKGGDAAILTVSEVRAIMANSGKYRSALALMIFAGIRPEEVAGRDKPPLLWQSIDATDRIIRIPADICKTGKVRTIEGIPDTLWRWIEPKGPTAHVSPGRTRQALARAQAAIGRPWPHDVMRHTFATYALALTSDAGKVATWLGHEGNATMLHRHYRGLTTRAEADRFWIVIP